MHVTPTDRKFGKYKPGDVFQLPDKAARVFIKVGKLKEVEGAAVEGYQSRMMQAAPASAPVAAPYGFKADGTPRLRPGRRPAA